MRYPLPLIPAVLPILTFGIEHEGKDLAVVGTLYKDMKLRPTILDEYIKVGNKKTQTLQTALLARSTGGKVKVIMFKGKKLEAPALQTLIIENVAKATESPSQLL
jgi:translation initiation factor IF-3